MKYYFNGKPESEIRKEFVRYRKKNRLNHPAGGVTFFEYCENYGYGGNEIPTEISFQESDYNS